MTTIAPNFSPSGGVGTTWKDPTGKTWKYTPNGWIEDGSGDIVTDTKNNDTFVVKPEEQGIVTTLKSGGAKDADIQNALKQRQQILASNANYGLGNIDLNNRPIVNDKAGEVITSKTTVPGDWSTLHSVSFNIDGKEVLIPRVRQGLDRLMTDQEALDWYKKTGEYLGKFDSIEEANKYALKLHEDQAKQYSNSNNDNSLVNKPTDTDPFKGKTKIQILREAFNNGVTDSTELDKIGKAYDLLGSQSALDETGQDTSLMTPEQQKIVKSQTENMAASKIQDLPNAAGQDSALTSLTTFKNGQEIIDMLTNGQVKTGLVTGGARKGIFGIGARSLGKTTKEEDYFAAMTETFAANFRKAISGTAVSAPEMQRLDAFLPNETKTEQANIEGIRAISDYLANKTGLQLNMDLSALKPQEPSKDPLNILGGNVSKDNPLGI